jgi:peptidoglycan/LPS O-acetylase OafA/YrhL
MLSGGTLGERLSHKRTVGFDYMRLSLAVVILVWHSFAVVQGPTPTSDSWYVLVMRSALPLFFALSGFLVASSLERLDHLPSFLAARFLRIFPALIVETLLSAFLLGAFLTVLPLGAYFADAEFHRYMLNIFGYVHFDLPGVFKTNPVPWVNRSLWTVPFELECYVALAVLYLAGLFRRPAALALVLFAACVLCAWMYRDYSYATSPLVPGRLLIAYYLAGNLVFKLRDRLPGGIVVALLMFALSVALLGNTWTTFLSPLPVAYASAALGCTAPRRIPVIFDGDYSYGMYLYAFPIQQACYQMMPGTSVAANALLATGITAIFAVFSWHMIEKPVLKYKSRFVRQPNRGTVPAQAAAAA